MGHSPVHDKKLYGTATVGTKGQIVIPADARKELGVEEGDRLYVIGSPDGGFLGLLKEEAFREMVQMMSDQIESFRTVTNNKK